MCFRSSAFHSPNKTFKVLFLYPESYFQTKRAQLPSSTAVGLGGVLENLWPKDSFEEWNEKDDERSWRFYDQRTALASAISPPKPQYLVFVWRQFVRTSSCPVQLETLGENVDAQTRIRTTLTLTAFYWLLMNFRFPLQCHQKYFHHSEDLAFHGLHITDDYTTNSHYITYSFLYKRLGECTSWTWKWKGY